MPADRPDPKIFIGYEVHPPLSVTFSTSGRPLAAVLFSKGFELANFEVLAEVVWTNPYLHESKHAYELGLKFIQMLEEDRQKLEHLLGNES